MNLQELKQKSPSDLLAYAEEHMYVPRYHSYI